MIIKGTGYVIVSAIVMSQENKGIFGKLVKRDDTHNQKERFNLASTRRLRLHQVELQPPLHTLFQTFPQLDNCFIPRILPIVKCSDLQAKFFQLQTSTAP
jgi:hypothetical protein